MKVLSAVPTNKWILPMSSRRWPIYYPLGIFNNIVNGHDHRPFFPPVHTEFGSIVRTNHISLIHFDEIYSRCNKYINI